MLFAIKAYESTYCGMHGIRDERVIECVDLQEAEEIAREMSFDVIESYCSNEIAQEIEDEGYDEDDIEMLYDERVEYMIWEVRETNMSLDELNERFYNDEEEFVKEFCLPVV